MCFTANYSRDAFVINTVASLILFRHSTSLDMKVIAAFLAFVGLMQLYDYVFWTNPPPSAANRAATKAAILTNQLQPVALALAFWLVAGRPLGDLSVLALAAYALITLPYTRTALTSVQVTKASTPKGGLYWEWNYLRGYRLVYSLFLLSMMVTVWDVADEGHKLPFAAIIAGSFAFAWRKYSKDMSTGRLWCYVAALVPAGLLPFA